LGNRGVEEEGRPLDVDVPVVLQLLDLHEADIAPRSDEVADHRDLGAFVLVGCGFVGRGHGILRGVFDRIPSSTLSYRRQMSVCSCWLSPSRLISVFLLVTNSLFVRRSGELIC
jgi:hypothetical protein